MINTSDISFRGNAIIDPTWACVRLFFCEGEKIIGLTSRGDVTSREFQKKVEQLCQLLPEIDAVSTGKRPNNVYRPKKCTKGFSCRVAESQRVSWIHAYNNKWRINNVIISCYNVMWHANCDVMMNQMMMVISFWIFKRVGSTPPKTVYSSIVPGSAGVPTNIPRTTTITTETWK